MNQDSMSKEIKKDRKKKCRAAQDRKKDYMPY